MIPSLPEMPAPTLLTASPGVPPLLPASVGAGAESGLDFAGLLGSALPPQPPANAMAMVTVSASVTLPEPSVLPAAEIPAADMPLLPTALPPAPFVATGRNLPPPGADLPEPASLPLPDAELAELPAEMLAPTPAAQTDAAPASEPDEPASAQKPVRIAGRAAAATPPDMAPIAEISPAREIVEPVAGLDRQTDTEASEQAPDAANPAARAAAAIPAPVAVIALPLQPEMAPQVAAPEPIIAAALAKRVPAPRMAMPLPARSGETKPAIGGTLPNTRAAKPEPSLASAPPQPTANALAQAALPGDLAAASTDSASPAGAISPNPTALVASAPPPPQAPSAPRIDARADAISAQQQSAIDQVGDLREALRSARPAMTLQHAEFGAVSLRLEAMGGGDWRAVLASRDPGFVPAIHAALADRTVAAAAASADSGAFMGQQNSGQQGASQFGTFDHRSGSTPNGGQGGSQPYLGQSSSRDGEAAPDHRRPSTSAALAARAEAEEGGSGSHGPASGGLFA